MGDAESPLGAEIKRLQAERDALEKKTSSEQSKRNASIAEFFDLMNKLPIKPLPYFLAERNSVEIPGRKGGWITKGKYPLLKDAVHIVPAPGYCWVLDPPTDNYDSYSRTVAITDQSEIIDLDFVEKDFKDHTHGPGTGVREYEMKVSFDPTAISRQASGLPFVYKVHNSSRYVDARLLAAAYSRYRDGGEWHNRLGSSM